METGHAQGMGFFYKKIPKILGESNLANSRCQSGMFMFFFLHKSYFKRQLSVRLGFMALQAIWDIPRGVLFMKWWSIGWYGYRRY